MKFGRDFHNNKPNELVASRRITDKTRLIINFKLLTFMLKLKFWKIYVCYDELDNSIFKDFYDRKQRRQWQSTPVLLPGKSHVWRSLVSCSPLGR